MRKAASRTRTADRAVIKKVIPSIKLLSQYMFSTSPEAEEETLFGYKIPSGDFVDSHGVKWQVQVHAIKAKKYKMKRNEITPIINNWAIGFKVRLFLKVLIDKIFDDEEVVK